MAAADVHNFSELEHNQGNKQQKQNETAERLYDSAYPLPGVKTQNSLPSRPDTSSRPEEPRRPDTSVPSDRVKEDDLTRLAKEIIATNKIPQELKDALDAKQTPDGKVLDINRLNEILRGLHSSLQIDLGRDADGKDVMELRDRQSGETVDTTKSSEAQNDKAAEKETLNKLADEIIKSGKITDWLRDFMRQTPKPGEKGLDIDELNRTLREKGSNLELTRTDTSDGLMILELRDRTTKKVEDLAWAQKPNGNDQKGSTPIEPVRTGDPTVSDPAVSPGDLGGPKPKPGDPPGNDPAIKPGDARANDPTPKPSDPLSKPGDENPFLHPIDPGHDQYIDWARETALEHLSQQQVSNLDKIVTQLDNDQKANKLEVPEELNKLLEGMSKDERDAALKYINAELKHTNPLVSVDSWDPFDKGDVLGVTHFSASGRSAFGQSGRCIGKPVRKFPVEKIDPAIIRALIGYPDHHQSILDSPLR